MKRSSKEVDRREKGRGSLFGYIGRNVKGKEQGHR